MCYYRIISTVNTTELGHYPQVKEVKHNCNIKNDPLFIDHYYLKQLDFDPIVSNPVLYPTAKRTDLIERIGIGFGYRLLISSKFKNILEFDQNVPVQYFRCPIYQNGVEYDNYWIMHFYETSEALIDFNKSEVVVRKRKPKGGTFLEEVRISNLDEFKMNREKFRKDQAMLYITKVGFKSNIDVDIFALSACEGGIEYFVSKELKDKIINDMCTGIDFIPSQMNYHEWLKNKNNWN